MSKQEKTALLAMFERLPKKDRVFLLALTNRLQSQHQGRIKGDKKGGE